AAVIGRRLSVEPSLVQLRMREGKITVLCESKVYKDAGRHRLSLLYENRRFRLIVHDRKCRPTFNANFGDRPPPRCANHQYDFIGSGVRVGRVATSSARLR